MRKNVTLSDVSGVDDLWIDQDGWINIVDYKATSKRGEVSLDADWQIGYKRQMEIYQWLFRNNGFKVSDTGYFVYCNGNADAATFGEQLTFNVKVIPYFGNDIWVEEVLHKTKTILDSDILPSSADGCDYCRYRREINKIANGVET
ncbi:MAG: PD-(D/E)XK nuclease family protein [Bdellovibrionales bacterium]